jgi:hypothetical protein
MKKNLLLPLAALAFVLPLTVVSTPAQPNILLIYADDLGESKNLRIRKNLRP